MLKSSLRITNCLQFVNFRSEISRELNGQFDSKKEISKIKAGNHKKRVGLKERQDVVNKSLLRGIRKFFVWGVKRLAINFRDLKGFNESIYQYVETLKIPQVININKSTEDGQELLQLIIDIIGSFI